MTAKVFDDPWGQRAHVIRFEWGAPGAIRLHDPAGVLVIVDVLSFTTSVSVALDRGTSIHPARDQRDAHRLAAALGVPLAAGRDEVSASQPWSLSPASLRAAPAPDRLVLASPNGATIASGAAAGTVVAACLRNARAVAAWTAVRYGTTTAPISVIAAGERWPDGSLRPAIEDLIGAGTFIDELAALGLTGLSPEATAARVVARGIPSIEAAIRDSASGVELIGRGYAEDVVIACERNVSERVPVLRGGAFEAAG